MGEVCGPVIVRSLFLHTPHWSNLESGDNENAPTNPWLGITSFPKQQATKRLCHCFGPGWCGEEHINDAFRDDGQIRQKDHALSFLKSLAFLAFLAA